MDPEDKTPLLPPTEADQNPPSRTSSASSTHSTILDTSGPAPSSGDMGPSKPPRRLSFLRYRTAVAGRRVLVRIQSSARDAFASATQRPLHPAHIAAELAAFARPGF